MMQETTRRALVGSAWASRRPLLAAVVLAGGVMLSLLPARASQLNQAACDACVAAILSGETGWSLPTPTEAEGWDNGRIVDAWMEVIAREDAPGGSTDYNSIRGLAGHVGLYRSRYPTGPRGLRSTLPSHIEPALLVLATPDPPLDELAARAPRGRSNHRRNPALMALGSIDDPSPEAVAMVIEALNDEDQGAVRSAVEAAGMLGRHASSAAPELERLMEAATPGEASSRHMTVRGRYDAHLEAAGALARVSDEPHDAAVAALVWCVQNGELQSVQRALEHLEALGERGKSASDNLMAALTYPDLGRPPVAPAVAATSPELLPELMEWLMEWSASDVQLAAWSADRELFALSQRWGDAPAMRDAVPALIATLDSRAAAEGLTLSKTLREIDSPEAQDAYEAYLLRERKERGASTDWDATKPYLFIRAQESLAGDDE
jgi:hypothetical protein